MMEVVLEQASLDETVIDHMSVTKGQRCGEVHVFLHSLQAAERCQQHFLNSRWSNNLQVRIVNQTQALSPTTGLSADAPMFSPSNVSYLCLDTSDFLLTAHCSKHGCDDLDNCIRNVSDASTEAATDSDGELSDGSR
jgi:hypothetical protein